MRKINNGIMIYTLLGLAFGVFYREFTKFHAFTERTQLAFLHVHALVLGSLFMIILLILTRLFSLGTGRGTGRGKSFSRWFVLYNVGLAGTLAAMTVRGILQVFSSDMSGLNHIAGLFHTILGTSLIWFFILLRKACHEDSKTGANLSDPEPRNNR